MIRPCSCSRELRLLERLYLCGVVWVGGCSRAAWKGTDFEWVAVRCSGQICSARGCAVWAMSCSRSRIARKTA